MDAIGNGIMAGLIAGLFMGVLSDLGYRLKIFKSSLIIVDGSFLFRFLKKDVSPTTVYLAGFPVHLATSALFGAIYAVGTGYFGLPVLSVGFVSLYFFIMWLSMLFVALPVAGQGFMGKNASSFTWIEQLFLHIAFGTGYYKALAALMRDQGIL